MAQNELQNILNPGEAPYLSLPPVEFGPLQMANIPRFQPETKPYSVKTNAMSLLGLVLKDAIMEDTITDYNDYYKQFSANIGYESPGGYGVDVGYNQPHPNPWGLSNMGTGETEDWNVSVKFPFNL